MYAHYEVLVHVDRFRNLDLFHQGEYAIGCRIFGQDSRVAARPLRFLSAARSARGGGGSAVTPPTTAQYAGGINDADNAFRCSSFYIRYREETRLIREGALFHVELPVPNDFLMEPLVVQFELLFQRPLKARALPSGSSVATGSASPPRLLCVATHQWRHHPCAAGGQGHCHITFDEMHTCVVEAYATSALLYYTAGPLEVYRRRTNDCVLRLSFFVSAGAVACPCVSTHAQRVCARNAAAGALWSLVAVISRRRAHETPLLLYEMRV